MYSGVTFIFLDICGRYLKLSAFAKVSSTKIIKLASIVLALCISLSNLSKFLTLKVDIKSANDFLSM